MVSLQQISSHVFGLTCAVVNCSEKLSVEDFSNAVLVDTKDEYESENTPSRALDQVRRLLIPTDSQSPMHCCYVLTIVFFWRYGTTVAKNTLKYNPQTSASLI